jgi:hypothetical protein
MVVSHDDDDDDGQMPLWGGETNQRAESKLHGATSDFFVSCFDWMVFGFAPYPKYFSNPQHGLRRNQPATALKEK